MKENIFNDIVLDRDEQYNASELDCWAFAKGIDTKNGVELKLGNMIGGFSIIIEGVQYPCSEILYLSGEFSNNTPKHKEIRQALMQITNGFTAKKKVKNKNKELIRDDFDEFSTQWMLWVVWQKALQNKEFQKILQRIPSTAIIIEDSSWQTSKTATLWGCKNVELKRARVAQRKELEKQYENHNITKKQLDALIEVELRKIDNIGVFVGKNNMGKILMLCKRAIENGIEPPINYDLLRSHRIYLNETTPLFAL